MRHLSGLDASFLYLETPEMPMHVGALHLLELPAGYRGDFVADLRAHMAARLPITPALRRKLVWVPLDLAPPAWVDAEPDFEQHVVRIKLPAGSGQAELEAEVGRLHPVLLPRDRPLWKFHIFDGLAPGPNGERRFAMYTQLHHAAVDGQAAVALAQAILDLSPEPRAVPELPARPPREKKGQLGLAAMLRGALANQLEQVGKLVKALPSAVGTLSQVAAQTAGSAASGTVASMLARLSGDAERSARRLGRLGLAPRTRLNTTVSDTRAFAGVSLPLAELNTARRRHHASLNDAVLMICSGALRRFFAKHGPLPRKAMVAAVPISLRAKGDASSNNQASMSLVSLGTHLADPAQRLAHVMAASASMKSTLGSVKSLLPTDFPSLGMPWLMQGLTALYGRARVAASIPPIANVTISNVPGPTVPLYIAGARMLTNQPTSIVAHGVALNVTVQTYDTSLEMGIIACGQAMPEVAEFAAYIEAAFHEFQALPAAPAPEVEKKAPAAANKRTPVAAKRRTVAAKPTVAAKKKPSAAKKKAAPRRPAAVPATTRRVRAGAPMRARASR
jgi:diacylglycerol O-acyltransferase